MGDHDIGVDHTVVANGHRNGRRVRFQDEPMVVEFSASARAVDVAHEIRLVSSGAGAVVSNGPVVNILLDEDHIPDLDPSVAAHRRAQSRQQAQGAMIQAEDTSLPDDVAAAEEQYDEPEELFNDMGIPIEPFNLRTERQEGYFDAAGNYVEYRLDNQDAWLDALDEQDAQDVENRRLAMQMAAAANSARAAAERDSEQDTAPPALEEEDVAIYRARIAALLLPHETVLDALRRLGNTKPRGSASAPRPRPAKRQRVAPVGDDTAPEGAQSAPQATPEPSGVAAPATAASPAAPAAPASASVTAVSAPSLAQVAAQATSAPAESAVSTSPAGSRSENPTAGAAAAVQPAGAPAGAAGSSAGGGLDDSTAAGDGRHEGAEEPDGTSEQQQQQKQKPPPQRGTAGSAGGGLRPGCTVPPENSSAFNRLTEMADLLLSVDFNIYSTSREQLLRSATETLGDVGLRCVEGGGIEGGGIEGGGIEGGGSGNTTSAGAADGAEALAAPFVGLAAGNAFGSTAGVPRAAAAEAAVDDDMFGQDFGDPAAPDVPHVTTTGAVQRAGDDTGDAPAAAAAAAAAETAAAAAAAVARDQADSAFGDVDIQPAVSSADVATAAAVDGAAVAAASTAAAAAAAPGAPDGAVPGAVEGYVPVEGSGGNLLYNSDLGYYYDTRSSLYGDAASGLWYRWEEGQYRLVDLAAGSSTYTAVPPAPTSDKVSVGA